MIITPQTKVLELEGSVVYEERTRAWTSIRFKKEIVYAFPLLRDQRHKVRYKIIVFFSLNAFEEFSKKVLKREIEVPSVLYFETKNDEEPIHNL